MRSWALVPKSKWRKFRFHKDLFIYAVWPNFPIHLSVTKQFPPVVLRRISLWKVLAVWLALLLFVPLRLYFFYAYCLRAVPSRHISCTSSSQILVWYRALLEHPELRPIGARPVDPSSFPEGSQGTLPLHCADLLDWAQVSRVDGLPEKGQHRW